MKKIIPILLLFLFIIGIFVTAPKPVSALVLKEDTWYTITSMNQLRIDFETVSIDNKIYAIGGRYAYEFVANNERYDPKTDKWTNLAPMPTPRGNFIIATCQNKIYCIGGADGTINPLPPILHQPLDIVEVYDPVTNTWESKSSFPNYVNDMQAQVVNGQIFIISPTGEMYMYNPITDKWNNKTSLPLKEKPLQTHVINEQIFVITQSALYIYNPVTDTWTNKTNMPTSMMYTFSVVTDSKIIVGDLCNIKNNIYGNMYQAQIRINIYDSITNVWQVGKTSAEHLFMWDFTVGITANVYAPKNVYVLGRDAPTEDPCNVQPFTLVYDPIGNVWSTAKNAYGAPYTMCKTVTIDDVFYVIGGVVNVKYVPVSYYNTQEYPNTPLYASTSSPSPSATATATFATATATSNGTSSYTHHEPKYGWPTSMTLVIEATIVLTLCIVTTALFFYIGKRKNKIGK